MASRTRKVLGLSAAVAALTTPALLATEANAADANNHVARDAAAERQEIKLTIGDDLMRFTVGENDAGKVVADHASHASHASHSSHYSSR